MPTLTLEEALAENASLKAEAKDRRIKNAKLKKRVEELETSLAATEKDRDAFRAKAEAAPGDLQKEVDRLSGELVTRDHRDAFKDVTEFTIKVKGDDGKEADQVYTLNDGITVDKLWKQLDYKAEGNAPDKAAVESLLAGKLQTDAYLFKSKVETTTNGAGAPKNPNQQQRREPGPGVGTRSDSNNSPPPTVASRVQDDYAKSGRNRKIPGRL